jgi:hypothetical protein
VTNPIEPLMISLVKGFIDDEDLNSKLRALYQVVGVRHLLLRGEKKSDLLCHFFGWEARGGSSTAAGKDLKGLQAKTLKVP